MRNILRLRGAPLSIVAALLQGMLVGGCGPRAEPGVVSLPAFSVVPPLRTHGSGDRGELERLIGRSVWAVVPARDGSARSGQTAVGSAVAVSGDALLANCDVADAATSLAVARRSKYRPVRLEPLAGSGQLCRLRPASVWPRTVAGYRPFADISVGEPVHAVVSKSSRTFALVPGSVVGKGGADDPFLETSVVLPPGTRSAALFDDSGHLVGFGSAGPACDAVVLAVPIMPDAVPWLAQAKDRRDQARSEPIARAETILEDAP
jgi:hypothetical protein